MDRHTITQSDEELWEQLKEGHKQSLRTLFLRYYDSLFRYGLSVCSKEELIEDCLQELFYQLWKGRNDLSVVQNVKGYVWISFRRKLMSQLKKKNDADNKSVHFKANMKQVMSKENAIINAEIRNKTHEKLQQMVSDLSEREREVVFLKYYEGMSYSEIEQILNLEYQTVRNYMYRAINRLRETLKEEDIKIVLSILIIFII